MGILSFLYEPVLEVKHPYNDRKNHSTTSFHACAHAQYAQRRVYSAQLMAISFCHSFHKVDHSLTGPSSTAVFFDNETASNSITIENLKFMTVRLTARAVHSTVPVLDTKYTL